MSNVRALCLVLPALLTGCTMASNGAVNLAYKAHNEGNYKESIRKVDLALSKYSSGYYTTEEKSQLLLLKAQSYSELGEKALAQSLYQYIEHKYPQTQAGYLVTSLVADPSTKEYIASHTYSAPQSTAIEVAKQACQSQARQEAIEYFNVHIHSQSTITEQYQSNQGNELQVNYNNLVESQSAAHVKMEVLKESVQLKNGLVTVHCKVKAVKEEARIATLYSPVRYPAIQTPQ